MLYWWAYIFCCFETLRNKYTKTSMLLYKISVTFHLQFRLPGMFRDSSQATADSSGRSTPPSSSTTVSGDSAGHSAGPTSSITKTPDSNPKANPRIIYTDSSRPSIASTSIKRPTDQQSTASCAVNINTCSYSSINAFCVTCCVQQ